jgi:hypothetical protein
VEEDEEEDMEQSKMIGDVELGKGGDVRMRRLPSLVMRHADVRGDNMLEFTTRFANFATLNVEL